MMLLFAPRHSDERFSAAPVSGLRSLLAMPDVAAGTRGGCVVTRAAAVAVAVAVHGRDRREDVNKERRDRDRDHGRTSVGHGEGVEAAQDQGEENCTATMVEDAKERGEPRAEDEEEDDGFWVPYGPRRCPRRRRLPPPIPSLVARGALRRTRTDDGRLVVRIVRPDCIRARRRREGDSPMVPPPPPLQELTTMTAAREDGIIRINNNVARADDDDDDDAAVAAPALPRRVPSLGCFEDVFKLGSLGSSSSSLHQMPSLRMVH